MCMLTLETFANLMFLLVTQLKMSQAEVERFFTAIRASLRTVNAKPRTPVTPNRVYLLEPTKLGLSEVTTYPARYLVAMFAVANGMDQLESSRLTTRRALLDIPRIQFEGTSVEAHAQLDFDVNAALYHFVLDNADSLCKLATQYYRAVEELKGFSLVGPLPGTVAFDVTYLGWGMERMNPFAFNDLRKIDALRYQYHDTLPTACAAWQYKELVQTNPYQGKVSIEVTLVAVASRLLQMYFKDQKGAYANLPR